MPAAYHRAAVLCSACVFLLLMAGCGHDARLRVSSAAVTDGFRIFVETVCHDQEPPLELTEACARAERTLIAHEPELEDAFARSRLEAVWVAVKPWALEAVRYAWRFVPGGVPCPV